MISRLYPVQNKKTVRTRPQCFFSNGYFWRCGHYDGGKKCHKRRSTHGYVSEDCKGRPPIERRYDYDRTIFCFENNRSYAHPRSKSERLGVEPYYTPSRSLFNRTRTNWEQYIVYSYRIYALLEVSLKVSHNLNCGRIFITLYPRSA